jgi:thiol-disulfide isomerase/thioredoxin
MSIKIKLVISSLFLLTFLHAQNVIGIYKINDLVKRIDTTRVPLVINFWATWCKPCIQELPAFDSLSASNNTFKVLLVSLDFKEDIEKKVNPFLKKNKVITDCILLDEVNGNDYINKISEQWSGAIPATLFIYKEKKIFVEKKLTRAQLEGYISQLKEK